MGQFALGIRSLLFKSVIFVIMAALLAWALGGTLFPRPEVASFENDAVQFDQSKWFWRVLVGGKNDGEVRWELMMLAAGESKPAVFASNGYVEVSGPVAGEDGLFYAGRTTGASSWQIVRVDDEGQSHTQSLPDRLAVEQQLARARVGLPLQDEQEIMRQRVRVLDPGDNSTDE
jgi:hypothetical protein